jgi:hypothetical protein
MNSSIYVPNIFMRLNFEQDVRYSRDNSILHMSYGRRRNSSVCEQSIEASHKQG